MTAASDDKNGALICSERGFSPDAGLPASDLAWAAEIERACFSDPWTLRALTRFASDGGFIACYEAARGDTDADCADGSVRKSECLCDADGFSDSDTDADCVSIRGDAAGFSDSDTDADCVSIRGDAAGENGDVYSRPVGYACYYVAADEGCLANLAVAPEHRRRGAGRALLRSVLDACARRGAAYVTLEVRESNAAARALYAEAGFREVAVRRRYYRRPTEDAVIMELPLAPA